MLRPNLDPKRTRGSLGGRGRTIGSLSDADGPASGLLRPLFRSVRVWFVRCAAILQTANRCTSRHFFSVRATVCTGLELYSAFAGVFAPEYAEIMKSAASLRAQGKGVRCNRIHGRVVGGRYIARHVLRLRLIQVLEHHSNPGDIVRLESDLLVPRMIELLFAVEVDESSRQNVERRFRACLDCSEHTAEILGEFSGCKRQPGHDSKASTPRASGDQHMF